MTPSLLPFFLLLSSTLLPPTASPPPISPPSISPTPTCTDELVLFSQCLPYIANPPNDLSSAASSACCDAFSATVKSNAAVCFCYLFQEPPILGFPLNSTRLLSLPSDCPLPYGQSSSVSSLDTLCSESQMLPPLNHSATFGLPVPSTTSGSPSGSSSPVISPSIGAVGDGGHSSGNNAENESKPSRAKSSSGVIGEETGNSESSSDVIGEEPGNSESSSGVIGEEPHQSGSSSSSSSETICRSIGCLIIFLFSLHVKNIKSLISL